MGINNLVMVVTQQWETVFSRENNLAAWRMIGVMQFNRHVLWEELNREERAAAAKHRVTKAVLSSVDAGRMLWAGQELDLGGAVPG